MIKDVLKENSIEATEEMFSQLKYDPKSVWGYVEVYNEHLCYSYIVLFGSIISKT